MQNLILILSLSNKKIKFYKNKRIEKNAVHELESVIRCSCCLIYQLEKIMASAKAEISEVMINDMNKVLSKYGISATADYLKNMLKGSDLEKFLLSESDGFDTYEREWFMDEFAVKLTGMEWPTNGDSEEYMKKFKEVFVTKVREEEGIAVLK